MATRLILVEGMVGAGKSTTAQWMESWLVGRGEDARAFHEFAPDHPVRSKAVDLLRAAYPEPAWSPDDVAEDGLARDRRVYEVEQWGRLAQHCLRTGQTVILESTFLQNCVMPAFTMGAPVEKLIEIADRIERQMVPARPLLVYLRPTDIAASIRRTRQVRSEAWNSWNIASVAEFPWARGRDLTGRDPTVELYRDWAAVVHELFERYPFPKVMVDDPQDDWDAALDHIRSHVRPGLPDPA